MVGKQTRDELRVQSVTCFVRDDLGLQRAADKREIADIARRERLMAAELVWETQRAVENGSFVEDDGVVDRAAADQAYLAHFREVAERNQSVRAGSQFARE